MGTLSAHYSGLGHAVFTCVKTVTDWLSLLAHSSYAAPDQSNVIQPILKVQLRK